MPISLHTTNVNVLADTPRANDVFLLDKNALCWTCYIRTLDFASAQGHGQKALAHASYVS